MTAAERKLEQERRKANEEWAKNHPPVNYDVDPLRTTRGFSSHVASAH